MKNRDLTLFILWVTCLIPPLGWAAGAWTRDTRRPGEWLRLQLVLVSWLPPENASRSVGRRPALRGIVDRANAAGLTLVWHDGQGRLAAGDRDPSGAATCWLRISPGENLARTPEWSCGRSGHARWALERSEHLVGGVPAWWWLTTLLPVAAAVPVAMRARRRRREDGLLADAASSLTRGEIPRTDLRTPAYEALAVMASALREKEERLKGQLAVIETQNREIVLNRERFISSEKLVTLGHLAAGLAHELGNPLAALFAHLDLLADAGLDDRAAEHLRLMQTEVRRMDELIRRLLLLARGQEESAVPAPPAAWLGDAVDLLRHQGRWRDVEFRVEADADALDQAVAADWKTVLINLLINAAQAMDGRGIVTVHLRQGEGGLELEVLDTGPGVPEALAERVFEPFFTTKDPGTGTGLGLSVCRMLAGRAGGTLRCVPGGIGGRFVARLPVVTDPGKKG